MIADAGLRDLDLNLEPAEHPETAAACARLTNRGRSVFLPDGQRLEGDQTWLLPLPVQLSVASATIEIRSGTPAAAKGLSALEAPGTNGELSPRLTARELGDAPAATTLVSWFEAINKVQQLGAADQFFADAIHSLINPGGLDAAFLLLRRDDAWEIVASDVPHPEFGISFERAIVDRVVKEKRTLYQRRRRSADSHDERQAVVASPLFDADRNVVGVVYAFRAPHRRNNRRVVRPLEAQLVRMLADSVTAGLIRREQETEALRNRVLFEQFFSPTLVRALEADRTMLDGRQREVTVLFADLRESSQIVSHLDTQQTYQFLGDVMDSLTESVTAHGGVVIDYYGDGLAAMWNAPVDQADHCQLAGRAALAMQAELPLLNRRWQRLAGRAIRLGVGLHTGPALVGNAGSRKRIKYGPRGATVSLASRVEQATKPLRGSVLATGATVAQFPSEWLVRRVCRAQLCDGESPLDLFEVYGPEADEECRQLRTVYEQTLELLEKRDVAAAWQSASQLTAFAANHDHAYQFLTQRIQALKDGHCRRSSDSSQDDGALLLLDDETLARG